MQQLSAKNPIEILRSFPAWIRRFWYIIPVPVAIGYGGIYEIVNQTCLARCAYRSPTIDGLYFLGFSIFMVVGSFIVFHWNRIDTLRNALTDDEMRARQRVKEALRPLAELLQRLNAPAAKHLLGSVGRSPQQIADDRSLWGESGSLLDWIHRSDREPSRGELKDAFLELGLALLAAGAANVDVERWIVRLQNGSHRGDHAR